MSGSHLAPVDLRDVHLRRGGNDLLAGVTWRLEAGQHAAVVGPNGAGKTSLLRILAGHEHPTSGLAHVAGERLGRVDVRELRTRVALVSTWLDELVADEHRVDAVVAAALDGATLPWRQHLSPGPMRDRAHRVLDRLGVGWLAERPLRTCSQGERQRVRLARALVLEPELLLLDEPFAGLDIGGREQLLAALDDLLAAAGERTTVVLVTHRLEEIPAAMDHAVVLADGRVVAAGHERQVLTDEVLSRAFGVPLHVVEVHGRWMALAAQLFH